ncbi:MAG: MFS transporter [Nocardioides sp.]|uniref:MFS transporter n=1 Tax=Nocardioides sp. TaxID=35761 RepID=UPI003F0FE463
MTWRGSLAPLAEHNFRWYAVARTVNLLGSTMGSVALAFAVLEISDSPTALGTVLAAHSIPLVVFLLAGGVIADRFGRTRVIQVCNVTAGTSNLAIAALVLSGHAQLWQVVVLTAVNGTAAAVSFPALASVLPQLVPHEHLQSANALMSMLRSGLTILGPTVAGVLVATVGPGWAIGIDGLTYLLSALALGAVRLPAAVRKESASMLDDLREGWGYVRSTRWLWSVVLAFCAICALHQGGFFTLGPVIAKSSPWGESGWGLVLSAEAVGLLVTGLVMLRLRLERPLLWGMVGTVLYCLPLVVLGLYPELPVLLVAAFVAGVGIEVFGLGWTLAMQEHVPPEMLSRAFSYDALGSFAAIPLGQLAAGPLAAAFGIDHVVLAAGLGVAAIALATLGVRDVRTLARTTSEPVSAPR